MEHFFLKIELLQVNEFHMHPISLVVRGTFLLSLELAVRIAQMVNGLHLSRTWQNPDDIVLVGHLLQ